MVRQRADALMLSGESAVGAYPEKALAVLRQVSTRIEEWCRCARSLASRWSPCACLDTWRPIVQGHEGIPQAKGPYCCTPYSCEPGNVMRLVMHSRRGFIAGQTVDVKNDNDVPAAT